MKRAIIVALVAILIGCAFGGVALAKPNGSGALMETHYYADIVEKGDPSPFLEQYYPGVRHVSLTLLVNQGLNRGEAEEVRVFVGVPNGAPQLIKFDEDARATSVEFDASYWRVEADEYEYPPGDPNDRIELGIAWTVTYPSNENSQR